MMKSLLLQFEKYKFAFLDESGSALVAAQEGVEEAVVIGWQRRAFCVSAGPDVVGLTFQAHSVARIKAAIWNCGFDSDTRPKTDEEGWNARGAGLSAGVAETV